MDTSSLGGMIPDAAVYGCGRREVSRAGGEDYRSSGLFQEWASVGRLRGEVLELRKRNGIRDKKPKCDVDVETLNEM
jgi:hypothetical protein